MMSKYIEKANTLIEAAPYIRKFAGKTVVIKYGGAAMIEPELEHMVMDNVALMATLGLHPVIVHGGGPAISSMLKRLQIETSFVDGLRRTDDASMEVTEMVLSGKINKRIVHLLEKRGIPAVGISGKDASLFRAVKISSEGKDIGSVGEITSCNPDLLNLLMKDAYVPVISPVSSGEHEESLNINADVAAAKIASTLQAAKLIFLSDVPGILRDLTDPESLISSLSKDDLQNMVDQGLIAGGMIPKTQCAAEAVASGVGSVHILDGRLQHALLLEIFTEKGVGTVIW
jgi:acetylglutamate kinase